MGPLGFALGLHTVISRAPTEGIFWSCFYLDDGTLVGRTASVFQYLEFLRQEFPEIGLRLNLQKCLVWGPGVWSDGGAKYPDTLPNGHPLRQIPIAPWVSR
jgi:hypothetical protein